MAKFLIDANLPYRFSLWHDADFEHVFDINDEWSDEKIWCYARARDLTFVTKDSDFSDRMLLLTRPLNRPG